MSNGNDNAFPHFDSNGEVIHACASGLSKREYFAAVALRGLAQTHGTTPVMIEAAARASVQYADALLAALRGGK